MSDPNLYREMCVPVTQAQTEANCARFFERVSELRRECHLADVYIVLRVPIVTDNGREGVVHTSMYWGDAVREEELAAWGLGRASTRRQAMIGDLLAQAPRNRTER